MLQIIFILHKFQSFYALVFLFIFFKSKNLWACNNMLSGNMLSGITELWDWIVACLGGIFSSFGLVGPVNEKTKKDSRRMGRSFCIYRNRPFDFIKNDVFMKNKSGVVKTTHHFYINFSSGAFNCRLDENLLFFNKVRVGVKNRCFEKHCTQTRISTCQ
jgi:hypothetical protein